MTYLNSLRRLFLLGAFSWARLAAQAETPGLPTNLGGGLDRLVEWYQANAQTAENRHGRVAKDAPLTARARVDAAVQRAVVDVRLDGSRPLAQVRAALEGLGAEVLAVHEVAGPGSTISAKLPLASAEAAAKLPGVFSIVLVHRKTPRVGKTTTQGAALMKTPAVNARGYLGAGITIGVLSDSFDVGYFRAASDVASGDLPGAGSAFNTTPVKVLVDGDPAVDEDEGRAMLQIIYDIAPKARLVFASVGETPAVFASRVRLLRTDPAALCDIIVDDVGYPDEPFFSDGIASQAVDDVTHSTQLAGKKVLYYSAVGNDGDLGFDDVFRPVTYDDVRRRKVPNNLKLNKVPVALIDGGFHNFAKTGAARVTQHVKATHGSADIDFQWDDPFIPGAITTDYNLLVFDSQGNFRAGLSGIDYNMGLGQALEYSTIPSGGGYQIAITRRNLGPQTATHLRYIVQPEGEYHSDFLPPNTPTAYGHVGAPGADGVGAFDYAAPSAPESFSSFGPLTIYFDRNGLRLATPVVRQQPTISAPDNVNTTFFPDFFSDTDGDGFPNFSGTSAAAPHAAAVAALLLEAAGGPGHLTSDQMRTTLQQSAGAHDLDPSFAMAIAQTAGGAKATLTAAGGPGDNSSSDPHFFHLAFDAPAGISLQKLMLSLGPTTLKFDVSPSTGYPFHLGGYTGIKRSQVKESVAGPGATMLNLRFTGHGFLPGATIDFGLDRDLRAKRSDGNSADLLAGATVTIQTTDGTTITPATGTFLNQQGVGYSPADGFGLIDAEAALNAVVP